MHYWSTIWSFDICIPCIIYIRVNMCNSLNTYNFVMVKTLIILSSSFSKYKVNCWLLWSVSYVITAYHNFFPHQPLIRNLLLGHCSWLFYTLPALGGLILWRKTPLLVSGTHCLRRVVGAAIKPAPIALCLKIANTPNKSSSLWMRLFLHWVSVAWLPLKCRPLF